MIPLPPMTEQIRIVELLERATAIATKRLSALTLCDDLIRSTFLKMFGDPLARPLTWPVRPLGEVTSSQLGKMLSREARAGLNPVSYLGNSHVKWRRFDLDHLPQMDFTEAELLRFNLISGDLLVCEGGEVGRCAIWRGSIEHVSFQKALYRVRCDDQVLLPEYLQEVILLMAERGGLSRFTRTSTIPHLSSEQLKSLPIPIPPISDQRIFQAIYAKIERLKHRLESAVDHQLLPSLTQRVFRGEIK